MNEMKFNGIESRSIVTGKPKQDNPPLIPPSTRGTRNQQRATGNNRIKTFELNNKYSLLNT